jgi:hypothetical protein
MSAISFTMRPLWPGDGGIEDRFPMVFPLGKHARLAAVICEKPTTSSATIAANRLFAPFPAIRAHYRIRTGPTSVMVRR